MADTGPEAARRLLSTVRAAAGRILERGGGIGQHASVDHDDPPLLGEGWGESSFCSSFPLHWIRAQLVLVFFNFHAGICLEKMWTRKSERNQGLERREMPLYTVQ